MDRDLIMTDEELLELAAKAAGIDLEFDDSGKPFYAYEDWVTGEYDVFYSDWNPLTDDGDALRLAVKLKLEIYHADDEGWAVYAGYASDVAVGKISYMVEYYDDLNNLGDPYAATRRAIVRAAASTGEKL